MLDSTKLVCDICRGISLRCRVSPRSWRVCYLSKQEAEQAISATVEYLRRSAERACQLAETRAAKLRAEAAREAVEAWAEDADQALAYWRPPRFATCSTLDRCEAVSANHIRHCYKMVGRAKDGGHWRNVWQLDDSSDRSQLFYINAHRAFAAHPATPAMPYAGYTELQLFEEE